MPLWLHQTFAWLFICLSTGLAARYGFKGSDTLFDGAVVAIVFGAIAAFASFGHGLAARTWLDRHRFWGATIGVIAVLALLVTLSNSLGAIAGRADASLAQRASASDAAKDARAELAKITAERAALPKFRPIGAVQADLEVARAARAYKASNGCSPEAIVYKSHRDACSEFRKLEGELATAKDAARLDGEAKKLRERLERAPAVQNANPHAAALSRLLGIGADDVVAWHYFAIALVLELCVMGTFVTLELRRERRRPDTASAPVAAPPPSGSVPQFMLACLPRDDGGKVSWPAIYEAYQRWCERQRPQLAALHPGDFGEQLDKLCAELGIRTRAAGRGKARQVYCMDVNLAEPG